MARAAADPGDRSLDARGRAGAASVLCEPDGDDRGVVDDQPDRELAIDDNRAYVRSVVAQFPAPAQLVFLGFSQGAAMAYRAAAGSNATGVIALGGDVPPDVVEATSETAAGADRAGDSRGVVHRRKAPERLEVSARGHHGQHVRVRRRSRMDGRIPRGGGEFLARL